MSVSSHLKFAVIGDPVDHSLSPLLHQSIFNQLHIDAEYSKLKCPVRELPGMMARFRAGEWDGLNVTIPLKKSVIPLLDGLNPRAQIIGSVNCIANVGGTLMGYNTDWFGFSMALKTTHVSVEGEACVVIGAGGAASGVIYSLMTDGAASVTVVNRTWAHSQDTLKKLSVVRNTCALKAVLPEKLADVMKTAAVVVNTTPVGMAPDLTSTPVPKSAINPSHILLDIIYRPVKTEFLKLGEMTGAKIINGTDMFIYQGIASLDIWLKERISRRVKPDRLKKILESYIK